MNKLKAFILFSMIYVTFVFGQAKEEQFNFWVGEWNLTWGKNGKGTNTIRKILNNKIIEENFNGTPSIPLIGRSYSAYDKNTGKWKQTWVDNSGSYLDFSGEFKDGKMSLSRKLIVKGKPVIQRMVWHSITKNAFIWNWESSSDNGKTWKINWKISYKRKS